MYTNPALIERSIGATLCGFSCGKLTSEEAVLDLFEVISMQINGRTHYSMAVIGYYVRAILNGMKKNEIELPDAFDAFVDAAIAGREGHALVTMRLAQPFASTRH